MQMASAYRAFGFTSVEFDTGDCFYRDPAEPPSEQTGWQVRLELPQGAVAVLRREVGMRNQITLAAGFVEMLENLLPEKLREFQVEAEVSGRGGLKTQALRVGPGLSRRRRAV
jgi:hypothetical protein